VALSVGVSNALDAAALLAALDRYPFGCSEQITSRALPLLYVNDLASGAQLAIDTAVDQRIRDSIDRLLARQGANGSFGLWSAGGDDVWLDAYVTDFLTRARERGFAVPDIGFKLALDRLRNFIANADDTAKDGGRNLAYALYVLARTGAPPIGARLRRPPNWVRWRRRSARRSSPPRSACSAIVHAPSTSMPQRSHPSRRARCSTTAAATMAQRCATRRR
jgi:uncharacterized protein YfaS (alpha-2-macroglobulin family)